MYKGQAPNCTATVTPTANNSGTSNLTFTVTDSGMPILIAYATIVVPENGVNHV